MSKPSGESQTLSSHQDHQSLISWTNENHQDPVGGLERLLSRLYEDILHHNPDISYENFYAFAMRFTDS